MSDDEVKAVGQLLTALSKIREDSFEISVDLSTDGDASNLYISRVEIKSGTTQPLQVKFATTGRATTVLTDLLSKSERRSRTDLSISDPLSSHRNIFELSWRRSDPSSLGENYSSGYICRRMITGAFNALRDHFHGEK